MAGIPTERYGVYMGIINMMIVVPMLIQTLTFGAVYDGILGRNPGNPTMFAGGLLIAASLAALLISQPRGRVVSNMPMGVSDGH